MRRFLTRFPDGGGTLDSINPATLPHLELLLRSDSSDVASLADGARVPSWADQSGHARNCNNLGGAALQPFWRASSSPKGLGLVGLEGQNNNNGEALFGPTYSLTSSRGFSLYLYYTRINTTIGFSNEPLLFEWLDGFGNFQLVEDSGAGFWTPTPPIAHFDWRSQGAFPVAANDCGPVDIAAHVFSLVLPAGGAGGNARQDGAAIGPQQVAWTWHDNSASNTYQLGQNNGAQNTSAFRLGAVALYTDTHSIGTRIGVETYLRSTWG